jgi:hypothetical protein
MWDDPFEIVDRAIKVEWEEDGAHRWDIIQGLPSVFAQSWSMAEESDALLRAYSKVRRGGFSALNTCPEEEGVRVRTTPRKLLEAVAKEMSSKGDISCFIGPVSYVAADHLLGCFAKVLEQQGLEALESPLNRARCLLNKRFAFSAEAEVRVMAIHHEERVQDKVLQVPISPNELIDEIAFDPRLIRAEMLERQREATARGYSGRFHDWALYEGILLTVPMPQGWRPPQRECAS